MIRIDVHPEAYVTPDMHDVILQSICKATKKNIVCSILGCCVFLRTPHRTVRFKPMY